MWTWLDFSLIRSTGPPFLVAVMNTFLLRVSFLYVSFFFFFAYIFPYLFHFIPFVNYVLLCCPFLIIFNFWPRFIFLFPFFLCAPRYFTSFCSFVLFFYYFSLSFYALFSCYFIFCFDFFLVLDDLISNVWKVLTFPCEILQAFVSYSVHTPTFVIHSPVTLIAHYWISVLQFL